MTSTKFQFIAWISEIMPKGYQALISVDCYDGAAAVSFKDLKDPRKPLVIITRKFTEMQQKLGYTAEFDLKLNKCIVYFPDKRRDEIYKTLYMEINKLGSMQKESVSGGIIHSGK